MILHLMNSSLLLALGLAGTGLPSGGCLDAMARSASTSGAASAPAPDTSTVRLRVSGMTCGSCPVTARLALQQLPGVYSAEVTLEDSLGVVRYDPGRVTPAQISAHLTKLTGFKATVLPNDPLPRKPGDE